MGAFFTNIQLKIPEFNETDIESVIEYLIKFNAENGFIKIDNEDEADKTVIICVSDNSDWISVYDEEMEDQDCRKLNKLSAGLSKQFKTIVLSVLVNDSDALHIGLNNNGTLKDTISNLSKEIDFNKRKPTVWKDVLLNAYTIEDLKIAWQNKKIFVEDFLTAFARYADLDTTKLLTGYEYLNEENSHEGIKIHFAKKDKKPASELGLTKFSMLSGGALVNVKRGEKQELDWMLTNHGTSSSGLDIVITGKGIQDGLLFPEIAQVSYFKFKSEAQNAFKLPFVESVATTGEKIFYVRISDIYIPKGVEPTYPITPKEAKRYGKIWNESAIKFSISFIGGEEGSGDFKVFFSPLVNRQEGTYTALLMKGGIEDLMNMHTQNEK